VSQKITVTLFSVLVFVLGAWAQTSPPAHHHPDIAVIDGEKNPELIPDATAFRLWLVSVSLTPNASEQDRKFQEAHLASLHLTAPDHLALLPILTDFKTQYLNLIALFNEAAQKGVQDTKLFQAQADDLVQSTRAAIARQLSAVGAANVEGHVQGEKKKITLHVTKEAQ
jgi:hypothetical protein